MATLVERLIGNLDAVFEKSGWGWHPPLVPSVEHLTAAQAAFVSEGVKAELTRRSDDELNQTLPGTDVPLSAIIQGIIAHDSYHCGQIHYIRAIQGIAVES